jgi:hypothetical protein
MAGPVPRKRRTSSRVCARARFSAVSAVRTAVSQWDCPRGSHMRRRDGATGAGALAWPPGPRGWVCRGAARRRRGRARAGLLDRTRDDVGMFGDPLLVVQPVWAGHTIQVDLCRWDVPPRGELAQLFDHLQHAWRVVRFAAPSYRSLLAPVSDRAMPFRAVSGTGASAGTTSVRWHERLRRSVIGLSP